MDVSGSIRGVGARAGVRVRVLSDLHFESMRDEGRTIVSEMDGACDVVVLAGDVSDADCLYAALVLVAGRFRHVPVLFVAGNHEFWGARSTASVTRTVRRAQEAAPNLRWLDREVFEIRGKRFLGCSLWFPPPPSWVAWQDWSDFKRILRFDRWVYDHNRKDVRFLRRELRHGDVVVTHYLPSAACVTPKYAGQPSNAFFVCDVTPLIEERKPSHWFFGHSHETVDVVVGETSLRSNPHGHLGGGANPRFDVNLTVEV